MSDPRIYILKEAFDLIWNADDEEVDGYFLPHSTKFSDTSNQRHAAEVEEMEDEEDLSVVADVTRPNSSAVMEFESILKGLSLCDIESLLCMSVALLPLHVLLIDYIFNEKRIADSTADA